GLFFAYQHIFSYWIKAVTPPLVFGGGNDGKRKTPVELRCGKDMLLRLFCGEIHAVGFIIQL
ncbi:MAG TPA: hypothetical protein VN631_14875, partial [Negativicutes bacterium]|nr:hypothetical protein [Negativicutes bacterium]